MDKKYEWIIAISEDEGPGVELEKVIGTEDEVTKYLLDRIRKDKEENLADFVDGTEDEDCFEGTSVPETGEVLELSGYNEFDGGYHINYTAQRLDDIPVHVLS